MSDLKDKFGEILVRKLRDEALDTFNMLAQTDRIEPTCGDLQSKLSKMTDEQHSVIQETLVMVIDAGIKQFLYTLDYEMTIPGGIEIRVSGKRMVQTEYELKVEFESPNGWISKFGKYDEMGSPKKL